MPHPNVKILLDSGAYSAWTKGTAIDLDEYVKYCLEYLDWLDYIVNLDVIPGKGMYVKVSARELEESAEQGWRNYRYMLQSGIPKDKLIHIFHQGEDFKWLARMVKSVPYIGISPANDKTTSQKIEWMDACMDYVLDSKGMPIVKFHGFGVTTLRIMFRYPWFSVDSTSWVATSRVGTVYVPRYVNGNWVYDEDSWKIVVSSRSPKIADGEEHFNNLSPVKKKIVGDYFAAKGFKVGESQFHQESEKYKLKSNEKWAGLAKDGVRKVETKVVEGLCNSYKERDKLNIIYFLDLENSLPEWPWAFKRRSNRGFGLV